MESLLFIVAMVVVHGLMMYLMPGMHGGHGKAQGHGHKDHESDNVVRLQTENEELKGELHALKAQLNKQ